MTTPSFEIVMRFKERRVASLLPPVCPVTLPPSSTSFAVVIGAPRIFLEWRMMSSRSSLHSSILHLCRHGGSDLGWGRHCQKVHFYYFLRWFKRL